jgi:hypothetical protein
MHLISTLYLSWLQSIESGKDIHNEWR